MLLFVTLHQTFNLLTPYSLTWNMFYRTGARIRHQQQDLYFSSFYNLVQNIFQAAGMHESLEMALTIVLGPVPHRSIPKMVACIIIHDNHFKITLRSSFSAFSG